MVQLFSHWFRWNTVYRVVLETVVLILSVVFVVSLASPSTFREILTAIPSLALFAATVLLINGALGLYQPRAGRTPWQTAIRVLLSLALAIPVAYLQFELLPKMWAQYEVLKFSAVVAIVSHTAIRGYAARVGDRSAVFANRVLVVGTGAEAAGVQESMHRFSPDFQIVGFYPVNSVDTTCVPESRVLDGRRSLLDVANSNRVSQIVVAVGEQRGGGLPLNELLDCKLAGIKVLDLSSYFERVIGQVRLDSLRASWLIFGEGFRQGLVRAFVKRAFDLLASAVLLVLAAPVMIVAALLIAVESGFPILYLQERVGQGGRIFRVIKFRSMRADAERDGKPRWASSKDDRVTAVGRIIRKLRIDELPQLFNVLKGDMSLVGPRPERPFFVDQLSEKIPFYGARHSIKPGVTGWAQVRYSYGASIEDSAQKLQYDLYYVKNHSLFLDLLIFLETVEVVLTGRGAQ
ncbi:MAG: TIGR03013 family PEP-CTERM/XrtA system glycosyltransferase [Sterolibacteriaceae bacterium]|uniref:TIGR03013 family PEP-CTERM/XrtA system glycosyltransferase n=1 Tax=Candidatus Methylophosphatis roskildensis TaxID=2899263 RepID=A0A9D7E323_9PROT|nr:TIGR03013 family PEP-CTERM/XrtA system glycosyltransferase [Candidatus Methylophosphatis roskildensis]